MAIFPKIQSPCPYKGELSAIMDGDTCRLCKREVYDLTDMRDEERVAFLAACAGEVCVSYKLPVRAALAAAIVAAAAAVPMAAAAQEIDETEWLLIGGIKDVANVEYVHAAEADTDLPDLPVVYEDQAAPAASAKLAASTDALTAPVSAKASS